MWTRFTDGRILQAPVLLLAMRDLPLPPLDETLGIRAGVSLSQKKESQMTLLSVHTPYREVKKVYQGLRGGRISRNTAHRIVQKFGKAVGKSEVEMKPVPDAPSQKPHVTADATMVYFRKEGWKEVKVGAFYGVEESKEAKGICYAGTVGARETLGQRLYQLAGSPLAGETQRMGFVSDAASWLGELRAMYFSRSTEIVDFFHAAEYVWKVAHAFYGEGSPSPTSAVSKVSLL